MHKCIMCLTFNGFPPLLVSVCPQKEHLLHDSQSCRIVLDVYPFFYLLVLHIQDCGHICNTSLMLLLFKVDSVVIFDKSCCSSLYLVNS